MERIRDFHGYALYKFTFTFTLHLRLLPSFSFGVKGLFSGDHSRLGRVHKVSQITAYENCRWYFYIVLKHTFMCRPLILVVS